MNRMNKEEYYLSIAREVAKRSTCLRSCYGAVIVKNDEIISTGYNGAPRGRKNCLDCNYCVRTELGISKGNRYELCRSVHAESNAIISASRNDMINSTLYLSGFNPDGTEISYIDCCIMCKRLIINAGIKTVIFDKCRESNIRRMDVDAWILIDDVIPSKKEFKKKLKEKIRYDNNGIAFLTTNIRTIYNTYKILPDKISCDIDKFYKTKVNGEVYKYIDAYQYFYDLTLKTGPKISLIEYVKFVLYIVSKSDEFVDSLYTLCDVDTIKSMANKFEIY